MSFAMSGKRVDVKKFSLFFTFFVFVFLFFPFFSLFFSTIQYLYHGFVVIFVADFIYMKTLYESYL